MPRPRMMRQIRHCPKSRFFKPQGIPLRSLAVVKLSSEEAEALRLKNIRKLDQEQAAKEMNTSRSTFQRILSSAYEKVSDAITNGKAIEIER